MKPVIYVLLAAIIYAFQNVLFEQKLAKYNTIVLLVYFYVTLLPLALISLSYLKISGQTIVAPSGITILGVILIGSLYFFADYFYIGAYTNGGTVLTVTSIMIMFPVFASAIKYFMTGGSFPNIYLIIGYLLAAVSVLFVAKGSMVAN
jgi:drug/metabolite transporter (DMT)-like permease